MTERITVSTPATLLAAVPHLLGFIPRDSVVVMGLRDGKVCLTARVDLGAEPRATIGAMMTALERAGADKAVLVVYGDVAPDGHPLPYPEYADRLVDLIPVRDAFYVHEGRFWSYGCDNPQCCPPKGGVVPAESVLAPAAVVAGRRLHGSREELAASVGPAPLSVRVVRDQSIDGLIESGAAGYLLDEPDPHYMLRLWSEAVVATIEGRQPAEADLALLTVALGVVPLRDAVIATSFDHDPAQTLPLLERLTREAPARYVAATATALAWHAYAAGNGALANVAVDRALAVDPTHSLATLILTGLNKGMPPSALRQIADASREALGL